MRHTRGFTVVELVVVITILAILVALAIAGISKSQGNARDVERKIDAEAIAASLEQYYSNGSEDRFSNYPTTTKYPKGSYPPQEVATLPTFFKYILPGLPADAGKLSFAATSGFRVDSAPGTQRLDLPAADNRISSDTTIGHITYQPITYNSSNQPEICRTLTQNCRAFRLYYRIEAPDPDQLVIIESRQQ